MEKYRSQSCRDGGMMEIKSNNEEFPSNMKNMRSYSTSNQNIKKHVSNLKKLSIDDPELQRKKRVAAYNVYSIESKVKGSFKKSFVWIRQTYTQLVYGYR
ncbi:unnamed protein product [Lactuca virosa]|uniref:Uncharacterized protein n=1 Tax=Lactuca virosa TaxID=75947 RepID=A0AAU9MMK9_9ASTR|nr:unnamed protein product [Lactuca virosa]